MTIYVILVAPEIKNNIKRLRKSLVSEERKSGKAYKVIEKKQARILDKSLLFVIDLNVIGWKPRLSQIASRIICRYSLNSCTSNDPICILNLLLKTSTSMKLIKSKKQSKRCHELSSLLNIETSDQIRSTINKLMKMEQITSEVFPARIATLHRENEREVTKLRDLVSNDLSSSNNRYSYLYV